MIRNPSFYFFTFDMHDITAYIVYMLIVHASIVNTINKLVKQWI